MILRTLDALVGAILKMKQCNDEDDYASGEIYVDLEKRLRYNGKKKGGIRPTTVSYGAINLRL